MKSYPLSFTAAALLPRESVTVGEGYLETGDWEATHQWIAAADRFGYAKPMTTRRIFNELSLRLKTLAREELEALVTGSAETVRLLLWQACCRAYPFVGHFALNVLRQKLLVYDYQLRDSDFLRFLRQESDTHPKLETMAESTLSKLGSRLYYILQEVGILADVKSKSLQPLLIPERLRSCVPAPRSLHLKYWLLSDAEMERYAYNRA